MAKTALTTVKRAGARSTSVAPLGTYSRWIHVVFANRWKKRRRQQWNIHASR